MVIDSALGERSGRHHGGLKASATIKSGDFAILNLGLLTFQS